MGVVLLDVKPINKQTNRHTRHQNAVIIDVCLKIKEQEFCLHVSRTLRLRYLVRLREAFVLRGDVISVAIIGHKFTTSLRFILSSPS